MNTMNRRLAVAGALLAAPALIMLGTAAANAGTDLHSLVPTPANTQRIDGPHSIPEGGIKEHFFVNGGPGDVMTSYKSALEGQGWNLTVANSRQGGATFTGTNGSVYGVFSGGGYGTATDIHACAWSSQPTNTHCG
jgi:hypothetical protein